MAGVKKSIEMLVLGLVAEEPSYAYLLKKSIDRLIGGFHRVSDGMLYPLLREMEEKGYISGQTARGDRAPDRVIYSLTEGGERELENLLTSPLRCSHYGDVLEFFARFALFDRLPAPARVDVLKERLKVCDSALQKLAEAAKAVSGDGYAVELIRRTVEMIEGECEWLIERISRETAAEAAQTTR